MKVCVTRDSICMGDDLHAPHDKNLSFSDGTNVNVIIKEIIDSGYLANWPSDIRATWSVTSKIPVAVVSQRWTEPKMLDVEGYEKYDIENGNLKLHFNWHSFTEPETVYWALISKLRSNRIRGLILGTAVGDSLGLPAEGLSPTKIKRLGWTDWKHRFFFGKGMVSDDTDHTFFVSQALILNPNDPHKFKKALAWKLRWWLLGIPAGIGFGTLRAILKLWLFVPLNKSGVWSAGNGPAMRSAIIGARFLNNKELLNEFVKSSTELTHADPKALTGALAVSYAASFALMNPKENLPETKEFFELLYSLSKDDKEWQNIVQMIKSSLKDELSVSEFVNNMNLNNGITGYIYHTVPVAIYTWLRHYGDFKETLTEVLNCGGDTDTVGAITGALAGTTVGEGGIPKEWVDNIMEWPRSIKVLRKVADAIANNNATKSEKVKYFWPGIIIRNLFQMILVLGHVVLRLLPARIRSLVGI